MQSIVSTISGLPNGKRLGLIGRGGSEGVAMRFVLAGVCLALVAALATPAAEAHLIERVQLGNGKALSSGGHSMSQAMGAGGSALSQAMATGGGQAASQAISGAGRGISLAMGSGGGPAMSQAIASGGRSAASQAYSVGAGRGGAHAVSQASAFAESHGKQAYRPQFSAEAERARSRQKQAKALKQTLIQLESHPARSLAECEDWSRLNARYLQLTEGKKHTYRQGELAKEQECRYIELMAQATQARLANFRRLLQAESGQLTFVANLVAEYLELSSLASGTGLHQDEHLAQGFIEMVRDEPDVQVGVSNLEKFLEFVRGSSSCNNNNNNNEEHVAGSEHNNSGYGWNDGASMVEEVVAPAAAVPSSSLEELERDIRRLVKREAHLNEPELRQLAELADQLEWALSRQDGSLEGASGRFRYLNASLEAARAVLESKLNEQEAYERHHQHQEPLIEAYYGEPQVASSAAAAHAERASSSSATTASSYSVNDYYGARAAPHFEPIGRDQAYAHGQSGFNNHHNNKRHHNRHHNHHQRGANPLDFISRVQPQGPSLAELEARERAAEELRKSLERKSESVAEALARADSKVAELDAQLAARLKQQQQQNKSNSNSSSGGNGSGAKAVEVSAQKEPLISSVGATLKSGASGEQQKAKEASSSNQQRSEQKQSQANAVAYASASGSASASAAAEAKGSQQRSSGSASVTELMDRLRSRQNRFEASVPSVKF